MLHGVAKPGTLEGVAAKRVTTGPGKTVPVRGGETQMIFHPFTQQHFVRIVVSKCKPGCLWLIFHLRYVIEEISHGYLSIPSVVP